MKNNNRGDYNAKQGRLPVFIAESLEISDPVLAFDRIMEEIGIEQYLKPEEGSRIGRLGYCRVNMLKTICTALWTQDSRLAKDSDFAFIKKSFANGFYETECQEIVASYKTFGTKKDEFLLACIRAAAPKKTNTN